VRSRSSRACSCSTSLCRRSTPRCEETSAAGWLELYGKIGHTTVFVTHDQEEALELADRVVTVDGGGARDVGPPDAALSGDSPYATDIGRLYPGGPVTVAELLRCL